MLIFEWRRRFRQYFRSPPSSTATYKKAAKNKLLFTFVVFAIGWHLAGDTVMDYLFFKKDEETGELIFIPPIKARQERIRLGREYDKETLPVSQQKFAFDA
ncbi:unnamed protein product [Bursaphelenchus okinawaensis]|uniref:Uncharacterized protein n=1 Tax=Bursaphelenchus okinawaensis TaxID=465554 RepID=A0A811JSM6_9BILA|nr:unnamed protein product [Bursaphelenchus okinawaensis]CAG9081822.1 unnamed protein product [Bursaphelenchus okinawaensis]